MSTGLRCKHWLFFIRFRKFEVFWEFFLLGKGIQKSLIDIKIQWEVNRCSFRYSVISQRTTSRTPPHLRFDLVFLKYAQCAEYNEKRNTILLRFLFFELSWKFIETWCDDALPPPKSYQGLELFFWDWWTLVGTGWYQRHTRKAKLQCSVYIGFIIYFFQKWSNSHERSGIGWIERKIKFQIFIFRVMVILVNWTEPVHLLFFDILFKSWYFYNFGQFFIFSIQYDGIKTFAM